jgi:hypothetical protein
VIGWDGSVTDMWGQSTVNIDRSMVNANRAETRLGWAWVRAGPGSSWASLARTCGTVWASHVVGLDSKRAKVHSVRLMVDSRLPIYEPLAQSIVDSVHHLLPTLWSRCTRSTHGSTAPSSPFHASVVVLPPAARPRVHATQLLGLDARASRARGTLAVAVEPFMVCSEVR